MNPKIDLIFLCAEQPIDWSIYSTKPTACLLVFDNNISNALLSSIVVGAVGAGCTSFLTWGTMADSLHDRIDEILEDGDDSWLSILTTSHVRKTAEDVSNFLFVATLPNRIDVRYVIIGDRPIKELQRAIVPPGE